MVRLTYLTKLGEIKAILVASVEKAILEYRKAKKSGATTGRYSIDGGVIWYPCE